MGQRAEQKRRRLSIGRLGQRNRGRRCAPSVAGFAATLAVALSAANHAAAQPTLPGASLERLPPVKTEYEVLPTPAPTPPAMQTSQPELIFRENGSVLSGPAMTDPAVRPPFGTAEPARTDQSLPINLATALRLSDARPLVVAAAQARIQIAAAELEKARVLWVPDVNLGGAYIYHAGGNQQLNGNLITGDTNFFYAGGSLLLRVATTDAIFEPLAAEQELRARQIGLQTARNEALLATADAYFDVQQARGSYAAMVDAADKGTELVRHVERLAKGLTPRDEVYRARTLLAELKQAVASAQQAWRVSSARLTRVLRLNPEVVVVPLEPDFMQITLIAPTATVDELIPLGLTNRPELASHQAIVQATLSRLKQERMRPLIPSVLLTGNGTPDFLYQGGVFGTGSSGLNQWAGRSDVGAQVVWKLDNLGFGNQSLIRKRRGEMDLAIVELYEVQDRVAAEVVQAKADVESAAYRAREAEQGMKESLATYKGNLRGLGQTTRFGDLLTLVNRPQEVTAALSQLQQAYTNYYRSIADFNRAQFHLFYALGFPAKILACERTPGSVEPVDTNRPRYLPRVCPGAPPNCPTP
jgi:outer membrane protein TolC